MNPSFPLQAPPSRLSLVLQTAGVGLAGGSLLLYGVLAWLRMGYPFPLEWTEGYMVDHVARVLGPGAVYAEPSIGFRTFVYPPMYYYVCALVAWFTGTGFLPLRLVSFLASIATMLLMGWMVYRETGRKHLPWIAAGLYAASYQAAGFYFDVARVDSLALAFFFGAAYLTRYQQTKWSTVALAAMMSCSMFTKQTYLAPCLALAPSLLISDWKRGMAAYILTFFLTLALGLGVNYASSGWLFFHAFGAASSHGLRYNMAWPFFLEHFLLACPVLLGISVTGMLALLRKESRTVLFFASLFFAMAFIAYVGRLSDGGAVNALMPGYAAFALTAVALYEQLARHAKNARRAAWIRKGGMVLLIVQFAIFAYNPRYAMPTQEDQAAGEALLEQMGAFEGEIWLTMHGYLPVLAGKTTHMPYAYLDSKLKDQEQVTKDLIQTAIREQRFDAIFFYGDLVPEPWSPYYRIERRVFDSPDAFYPVCGYQVRPKTLLVPKTDTRRTSGTILVP